MFIIKNVMFLQDNLLLINRTLDSYTLYQRNYQVRRKSFSSIKKVQFTLRLFARIN